MDRPGSTWRALHGSAGAILTRRRLQEHEARLLPNKAAPAFVYLHGPRSQASSTALRDAGKGLAG